MEAKIYTGQRKSCGFCYKDVQAVIRVADVGNINDMGTVIYLCMTHASTLAAMLDIVVSRLKSYKES